MEETKKMWNNPVKVVRNGVPFTGSIAYTEHRGVRTYWLDRQDTSDIVVMAHGRIYATPADLRAIADHMEAIGGYEQPLTHAEEAREAANRG